MKKYVFFAIFAVLGILCAYAKPATVSLDAAIKEASKEITTALPAGTKVALLNFSSDSDAFSDYVIEEMSIALVRSKKLVIVDRKEIELIRREMDFQMSGDVSDESAQQIGAMLGAQSIVSGSMVNVGDSYRFRTKVINVVSAAIQTSSSINVKSDKQVTYLLSQGKKAPASSPVVAQGGAQTAPAQAAPAQTQPVAPATTTYKVGDKGPAGGLIFYDKGNNNGGWRYLEAAPVEAEFQIKWAIKNTFVVGTEKAIGSGKQNTQLILKKFKETPGEWDTAVEKANDLVFNRYDDWFLPSQAELDQMYGNLKRKYLGDFNDSWYWSSTDSGTDNIWNGDGTYAQDFKDGSINLLKRGSSVYVRPIRQVPGSNPARSSADDPAGIGAATSGSGKSKIRIGMILGVLLGAALIGYVGYVVVASPAPAN